MGTDHRTTQQLVVRIQQGDREAFNLLFARYYPRIKLLVKLHMLDRLKSWVEPDDVIQELYMEVFKNFHKFEYRDPNSFYKWVVKVLGWKLKDFDKYFFKAARRRAGSTVSLQDRSPGADTDSVQMGDQLPADVISPAQEVIDKEGYQMLEMALQKLPQKFHRVIRLRQFEELSVRETAAIMEMTPGAVSVLFHRAQQRLHELLREMAYFQH